MTAAQYHQIDALFMQIVELEDPSERATALATIGDPEVHAEVLSLLAHTGPREESVATSVGAVMRAAANSGAFEDRTIGPGTRFERYRIEHKLGQGGMGDVYAAVRENDFHKQVALKIVRYGLDSDFARARFQQERQTLAGLEHPYIARLLDGGEATNGCPYLVLEFVDGVPIDQYTPTCTRDQILSLFLKVCEAVDYAHRNLIIHRDLKPANILVTADGTPKLLDFGIAKLLDANPDAAQTIAIALTPQYASPEQVRNQPITTACDVYSLGVILYQLLTNARPYQLETTTALELERVICFEPPTPPHLGNELDDILLMSLRKEPARRYTSVAAFAEDITRFLDGHPVLAAPDTFRYRTRKFVARHWVGLAAATAIVLAVAAGTTIALHQARIARQRFDQVRTLAHSFVFDYGDDLAKIQGTTAVREKMVGTALVYLDNLSSSSGNDLALQKELALSYQKIGDAQGAPSQPNLGHTEAAVASYRKAAEIGEKIAARDPAYRVDLARFYAIFSQMLLRTGEIDEAQRMGEAAVRNLQQAAADTPAHKPLYELAEAWCSLGTVDEDAGRTTKAYEGFTRCDEISRELLFTGRTAKNLKLAQNAKERMGTATMELGHLPEALAVFQQDQDLIEEILRLEPSNPRILRTRALLDQYRAEIYYDDRYPNFDNPAESVRYATQYLDHTREMVARDEKDQTARFGMAIALFRLSYPLRLLRPAEAVERARESVRIFDTLIDGGNKSFLVVSRRNRAARRLAEALLANHQIPEASRVAAETLNTQRSLSNQYPKDTDEQSLIAMNLSVSAQIAAARSDTKEAIEDLLEADRIATGLYNRDPTELQIILPLSKIRELLAEQFAATGETVRAHSASVAALQLWISLPQQNDFVRRRTAALMKRTAASR